MHALNLELDVHGARLQPRLDNSVARLRGVWCWGNICCRGTDGLRPCCGADREAKLALLCHKVCIAPDAWGGASAVLGCGCWAPQACGTHKHSASFKWSRHTEPRP